MEDVQPPPPAAQAGRKGGGKGRAAVDAGPDLCGLSLLRFDLQLPSAMSPGAIQANKLALRVCACAGVAAGGYVRHHPRLG